MYACIYRFIYIVSIEHLLARTEWRGGAGVGNVEMCALLHRYIHMAGYQNYGPLLGP